MPKAATSPTPGTRTGKPSRNGSGKELKTRPTKPELPEYAELELAKAEFKKRRTSQIASIKKTDKKLLRAMLYQMVLGRHFEEKCAEVYRMGKIGGFCHLYIGQEAIGVGSMMALEPKDMVITSYRDHVQAIVKGMTPESVLANCMAKPAAASRARAARCICSQRNSNSMADTVS